MDLKAVYLVLFVAVIGNACEFEDVTYLQVNETLTFRANCSEPVLKFIIKLQDKTLELNYEKSDPMHRIKYPNISTDGELIVKISSCITNKECDEFNTFKVEVISTQTNVADVEVSAFNPVIAIICFGIILLLVAVSLAVYAGCYFMHKRRSARTVIRFSSDDGSKFSTSKFCVEEAPLVPVCLVDNVLNFSRLQTLLREESDGGNDIAEEFNKLLKFPAIHEFGHCYKDKNRYNNVLPGFKSRVVLKIMDRADNDYINANYINGYERTNKYIATQAPLQNTACDFWRMVVETGCEAIVMLTNFNEKNKSNCYKYWLENSQLTYDRITVKHRMTIELLDYDQREFFIYYDDEMRKVIHYHFKAWTDKSLPLTHYYFTHLLRDVRSKNYATPIVVHCTAGIGRTGAYILCDYVLDKYEDHKEIDFPAGLVCLRSSRMHMVQTVSQYKFCYCTVYEYIKRSSCNYTINFDSLKKSFDQINAEEVFNKLDEGQFWRAIMYDEVELRRQKQCCSSYQPFLTNYQLIAQVVPNQLLEPKYIATNQPLENAVTDFWKMIDEHDVKTVISMYEPGTNFYPTSTNDLQPTDYLTIKHISTNQNNYTLQLTNSNKHRTIQLLQLNKQHLTTPEAFICSYKEHISLISSHNKTVICCPDGVTANGIFLAFSYLLERMQKVIDADIIACINSLRLFRKEYITDYDQLYFVYECLLKYLDN